MASFRSTASTPERLKLGQLFWDCGGDEGGGRRDDNTLSESSKHSGMEWMVEELESSLTASMRVALAGRSF